MLWPCGKYLVGEDEDSENDPDYIPDDTRQKLNGESDSSDSSDSDSDTGRRSKNENWMQLRLPLTQPSEEEERLKKNGNELFQASFASSNSLFTQQKQPLPWLVNVVKKYRFPGEDVIKVEEVPEDSPEATIWPSGIRPSRRPNPNLL